MASTSSTAAKNSTPPTLLLEVSDASTRGATCAALLHSSLEAAALKAEGALSRAVGGTLRMGGVVAWRPTGTRTREEEEEAEEEAAAEQKEGDENNGGDTRKKKSTNDFVRPFLLPTPAVLLVAPDLPTASILAGRGDGAPAAISPVSAVASSSSAAANPSSPSSVVAAGVVVSVGPVERDFGTAAAARAASGVARVVWLSDDFEKIGGAETAGAETGAIPPPTPLLLLDALAAAGDALSPGEVLLLPGATRVPPPPGSNGNAPCALEARPGALLVVVPCRTSSSSSSPDGDGGDVEGLAAARPSLRASRGGESRRPRFAALRPGVTRVALAGTLVSSSLAAASSRGGAAGRKAARQQQTRAGGGAAAFHSSGGNHKERDLVLALDDGSGATVELRLPSATAPRSAWAARRGEVVVATAARASVERKENGGEGTKVFSFVVVPASRCAFQSLPRLPALLASPSLAVPGLVTLESALEQLLSSKSKEGEGGKKSHCCALVDAVVAAAPAVAVRRAHSSCGRPLRRSALDPSAMAEMMMMMDEEGGEGEEIDFDVSERRSGSDGGREEPAAAVAAAPAAAPALPAAAAQGSLVLSVPAPTPGPAKGGVGGCSTGKKKRQQQPPTTPAAAAEAAADDAGFLWSCDFCGEDCSASGVALSLELDLKLDGEEGAAATARAEGAAAASLLGCVPSEFVAWAPKARAAKAAALEGRRVRVALVPSAAAAAAGVGGGDAVVDVVGVMVLDDDDDDDDEEEEDEQGSASGGEVR